MKRISKIAATALAVGTLGTLLSGFGGGAFASITHRDAVPSGVHLIIWSYYGGPEFKVMTSAANAWAKQHDDTVTLIDKSAAKFQDFATAARSGSGPDIVIGVPQDNLGTFQVEGLLSPVPAGTINTGDYIKPALTAVTLAGRMYAIPLAAETYGLFYNTKEMKAPPTTWAQFIADAKKFGFAYDINNFYFSYGFIGGMGGYVFGNNHGTANVGDIGLGNAGAVKGFELIKSFVSQYRFMTPSITGDIAKSMFQNQKNGLYISGPWDVSGFEQAHTPFAVEPLPLLPNGKHPQTFEGYQTMFVNAESAQQAADWSLTSYIAKTTPVVELKAGNRVPVIDSIIRSKDVQADKYASAFAAALRYGTPLPNVPAMQAVWIPAGNALQLINKGQVSPAAGAANAVNQIRTDIAMIGQ